MDLDPRGDHCGSIGHLVAADSLLGTLLHPVIRQNCVRDHVITLQRVRNGDEDRRAAGLR